MLQQHDPSESSTSLRNRAEALDSSKWSRASIQSSEGDGDDNRNGENGLFKDKIIFSWAWSLWEVEIAVPANPKKGAIYGFVARASKSGPSLA